MKDMSIFKAFAEAREAPRLTGIKLFLDGDTAAGTAELAGVGLVLLTHGHPDHAEGAAPFAQRVGAPVAALATTMLWASIILPMTPPELLAAAMSVGSTPTWLAVDKDTFSGRMLERPQRASIAIQAQEQLVVELYSK